jgi:hypothetical protein
MNVLHIPSGKLGQCCTPYARNEPRIRTHAIFFAFMLCTFAGGACQRSTEAQRVDALHSDVWQLRQQLRDLRDKMTEAANDGERKEYNLLSKRSIELQLEIAIKEQKIAELNQVIRKEQEFNQNLVEYQRAKSSEAALKVIWSAVRMQQLPPVPAEANKHFVLGSKLFGEAKTSEQLKQCADEFSSAIQHAPWFALAHYKLALVNEALGNDREAVDGLKIYQIFDLSNEDYYNVKAKIYTLEKKQHSN